MTPATDQAQLEYNLQKASFLCQGRWSVSTLQDVIKFTQITPIPEPEKLIIDGKEISYLDSAAALFLKKYAEFLKQHKKSVTFKNFSNEYLKLLELIDSKKEDLSYDLQPQKRESLLSRLGKESISKFRQADGFIILIGDLSIKLFEAAGNWKKLQVPSIMSIIYSAGLQALPILALLSFLIGVVLAYQMGLQLQTYGANIYIAYLSGLAIFREFAPLITAVIVAGRTSSSFTAQIGSMQINEEIDALKTMGLSPTALLVLPKTIGLFIVFPLLIFWSNVFSIFGSMYMSKWMLDVGYLDFLNRLQDSLGLKQLMLGLYKAPAFALIIALVGCFQGFAVQSNASSIGSQTTRSVVQALFLIIIADAIFSIVYSWLDL
jgi:phospholipid/cholesterol/gamma-HCH transport system permease protein